MSESQENATPEAPAAESPIRDGAAAERWLKAHAPALFGGAPKPIKLQIQKDIEARFPGQLTKAAITAFLRRYTASTSYLMALTRAAHRFDLDGQPAGDLSDEHRAAAKEAVAQRRERQRAREAEMANARQWRADLLRDWGRTSLARANFCALKGIAETALDALLEQAKTEAAQRPAQAERADPRPAARRGDRQRPGARRGAGGGRPPAATKD